MQQAGEKVERGSVRVCDRESERKKEKKERHL